MAYNRRRDHDETSIPKIVRNALKPGFAHKAGDRINTFIRENPLLSTCLGLAAGFALGMRLRR
jgi:hypothetical protein